MSRLTLRKEGGSRVSFDPELKSFKTQINLAEFLAEKGFILDKSKSSNGYPVLRSGSEKLVVRREEDGNWTYFNTDDVGDSGSIIDFLQKRTGKNLGQVRKMLRPWVGKSFGGFHEVNFRKKGQKGKKNKVLTLEEEERNFKILAFSHYLEGRGIGKDVYLSSRFIGSIRIDPFYKSVAFPHRNEKNVLTGFEKKNKGYSGFTAKGEKNIWMSQCFEYDRKLVLTESAIDALSYQALFLDDGTRYASLAGNWNPERSGVMVRYVVEQFSLCEEVVLAFDNDESGRKYGLYVREVLSGLSCKVVDRFPLEGFKDWNDVLQKKNIQPSLSLR